MLFDNQAFDTQMPKCKRHRQADRPRADNQYVTPALLDHRANVAAPNDNVSGDRGPKGRFVPERALPSLDAAGALVGGHDAEPTDDVVSLDTDLLQLMLRDPGVGRIDGEQGIETQVQVVLEVVATTLRDRSLDSVSPRSTAVHDFCLTTVRS